MAEPEQIRNTVEQYLAAFAEDREGWLALFTDDATVEDPVGSPVREGKEAIGAFWDEGHAFVDRVDLVANGPVIVLGNEASFTFFAKPVLGGVVHSLPAIDVMTFADDGRITGQRAFVDMTMLAPE